MSETDTLAPWRRWLGILTFVLAGIALVGFVAGAWNPWRLVRLLQVFGNPFAGLVVVSLLAVVTFLLLKPVRNEAEQGRRNAAKWILITVFLLSLPLYGLFNAYFSVATRQLDHSPSGRRTIAAVTHGTDPEVHLWTGKGLGMREVGSLGRPCGQFTARFQGEDLVHISSLYAEFDVRLDPTTGRVINPIGPICSG